ncbi:MAG TPA: MATE family efflux transporter, partial [bacterium]|nr:MATE family efflux transporter [bacterium]
FHVADTWWVSRFLGAEATAALGSSGFFAWAIFSIGMMASDGVNAMVARFTGAGDRRMTGEVAYQGFVLAMIVSMVVMVAGFAFKQPIFGFLQTEDSVTTLAYQYLDIIIWGASTVMLFMVVTAIFRAIGDTTTPLILLVFAGSMNFLLDPLLMLGLGPFPRLGVQGAALATVISRLFGVVFGVYLLCRHRGGGKVDWHLPQWMPNPRMYLRILRIGIPSSLSGLLFSLVYFCLLRVIAQVSPENRTVSVAALTIGFRVESFAFMWSAGFSTAAATLVGQNLGSGKPDRAEQCAWRSALTLCLITGTAGVFMMIYPKQLVGLFSKDPDVIVRAASYVWVMGVIQVPQSLAGVLRGAFAGAGNTLPTLLIDAPMNFARVPLGYLMAIPLGLGLQGVWWAIGLSNVGKGLTLSAWFSRGRWKHHKV